MQLTQALRRLARSPGFSLIALLMIAIGIGATTAIFSVVNGVLIQPLPYPDSDRLVEVFLAAIGVYGVLSYALSRRVPEIGVRVAFGASRRAVFGLLFGQGLRLTLVGVAAGIPLAIGASQLLSSLLFGVDPFGVGTLAAVALGVVGVGAVVSCWPALTASRVEPMQALRDQ